MLGKKTCADHFELAADIIASNTAQPLALADTTQLELETLDGPRHHFRACLIQYINHFLPRAHGGGLLSRPVYTLFFS
jgi:hypothetical protein